METSTKVIILIVIKDVVVVIVIALDVQLLLYLSHDHETTMLIRHINTAYFDTVKNAPHNIGHPWAKHIAPLTNLSSQ